jgi:predicted phosphohydrolase
MYLLRNNTNTAKLRFVAAIFDVQIAMSRSHDYLSFSLSALSKVLVQIYVILIVNGYLQLEIASIVPISW